MATTRTSTKAPTKREIETHTRDDLKTVYMLTFDQHSIIPSDIPIYTEDKINLRYARELLGVLVHEGLVTISDVNGEDQVWQVTGDTIDDISTEEADAFITKWLDEKIPNPGTATTATGEKVTVSKPKPAQVKNPTGTCRCGCGENVAKSNYRPGHDARHAGNVARAIAADGSIETTSSKALLDALPSDALKQKATDMANRLIAKANTKANKTEAPPVVKAKVGRATYEGVVDGDTFHYVDGKQNEKSTTKFTLV